MSREKLQAGDGRAPMNVTGARQDAAARYRILLEISEAIASHRQIPALVEDLAVKLRGVVRFDGITMTLYSAANRTIRLFVVQAPVQFPVSVGRILQIEDTPAQLVLETGLPHYVPDIQHDDRFPQVHELMRSVGIRSYVILPMSTARHAFLGGFNFASLSPDAYSPEDILFMRDVTRQVAIAVENALSHEEAEEFAAQLARERDRLRLLLDINNAVVTHLDTPALMRAVSDCLQKALSLDVVLVEVGADASLAERKLQEAGIASVRKCPLVSRGETLGYMLLGSRDAEAFSEERAELASEVATQVAIALDNARAYEQIEALNARLSQEKVYLEDEIRTHNGFEEMIGRSRSLLAVLREVETVAPSDSAVVVYGETGTGKELIARAIHELSTRRRENFVKLNCAAIPTGLLESELFGHEKGAFTGAIERRVGRFELANGGTLFLDEIGEIPLELQPKLLRVLQEREFERLGSSRTLKVDVRIIAATNRDLRAMVRAREFRDDLYYRLNVFPIHLPPLRDRREDIPDLVRHFACLFARRMKKRIHTIPSETMEALERYAWPGNVRELQNLVERAVILSPGDRLHIPLEELKRGTVSVAGSTTLEEAERKHIVEALRASQWVLSGRDGAAARLGLKRSTLQFRMKKLGITRPN